MLPRWSRSLQQVSRTCLLWTIAVSPLNDSGSSCQRMVANPLPFLYCGYLDLGAMATEEPDKIFNLEKMFKTTFSLVVLHMWLVLRRLKEEGEEGIRFGQYMYKIYNHDVEMRVSRAGVNLMLTRWMKDLEKIFYGNIVAYDTALLREAKQDELSNVIWRNIFSDGDESKPTEEALHFVLSVWDKSFSDLQCFLQIEPTSSV